jgi:hypothetical protein
MKDRFDLENEIMSINSIADDLVLLNRGILEHGLSTDETVNVIEGLHVLLKLKSVEILDTMCQVLKLDQYYDSN